MEDNLEIGWYIIPVEQCSVEEGDTVYIEQVVEDPQEGEMITTAQDEQCTIRFAQQVESMAYVEEDLGDERVLLTNEDGDNIVVEYYDECGTIGNFVADYIMLSTSDDDEGLLVLPDGSVCTVFDVWAEGEEPDLNSATTAALYYIDETKALLTDLQQEVGSTDPIICNLLKDTYIDKTIELKGELQKEEQTTEVVWAARMLNDYLRELRRMERECTDAAAKNGLMFSDISPSHPAYEQITYLRDNNVLKGYPDGSFKPEQTINRAEFVKILLEGFFSSEIQGEGNCFPDVQNEWFAQYVCAAKRMGWISGYDDGLYRPGNTINRAETIKILMSSLREDTLSPESLPSDVQANDWFASSVRRAYQYGIETNRSAFRPGANLTRGEVAIWIYNGMMLEQ